MAKATSYRYLWDYCPKLEKLLDEIKAEVALDDQKEFVTHRKTLLRQSSRLEQRFTRFPTSKRHLLGAALGVYESLYFRTGAPREREQEVKGALTMAQVLLKQVNKDCFGFLQGFSVFATNVINVHTLEVQRVN